jgi:hypothetical protein
VGRKAARAQIRLIAASIQWAERIMEKIDSMSGAVKNYLADQLLSPEDAVDHFVARLNEELSTQIKLLLEERHLYQKVRIDAIEQIRVEALRRAPKEAQEWVNDTLTSRLAHQLDLTIGGYPTQSFTASAFRAQQVT